MITIAVALDQVARRLDEVAIDGSRREARLLLAAALKTSPETIFGYPERLLSEADRQRLCPLVERRLRRQPLSQILGQREFWSLPFAVTPDTLTPRPDSEPLINAALDHLPDQHAPYRVLDLGTGTGCLLLAVLHQRPAATGVGVDVSRQALDVANRNAQALGLTQRTTLLHSDWWRHVSGRFDLILSNPPYIPSATIATLEPEVAEHEPRLALDGGDDGLAAYTPLCAGAAEHATPGAHIILEVGQGQAEAVTHIARRHGLSHVATHADLSGIPRCLVLAVNAHSSL